MGEGLKKAASTQDYTFGYNDGMQDIKKGAEKIYSLKTPYGRGYTQAQEDYLRNLLGSQGAWK